MDASTFLFVVVAAALLSGVTARWTICVQRRDARPAAALAAVWQLLNAACVFACARRLEYAAAMAAGAAAGTAASVSLGALKRAAAALALAATVLAASPDFKSVVRTEEEAV